MTSWYHRTMYRLGAWLHWRSRFWDTDEVVAHEQRWTKEFGY